MHKVSVIVPVYNVESYLEECLDSIIHQTFQCLEIILVDDGSSDRCPEICDRYALEDDRIRVIHKENGGLSDARNAGMAVMTGDFVLFVDSDDYVAADMIECLMGIALEHGADIVECGFVKTESSATKRPPHSKVSNLGPPRIFSAEQALERLMLHELKQVVWNKLYISSVVDGLLFEKGRLNEDEFWTYQVFGKAGQVVQIENVFYYYRQQPESIMNAVYSLRRLDGLLALENRMQFMEKYYPDLLALAEKKFCFSGIYHGQKLVGNSDLDPERIHLKKIQRKIRHLIHTDKISALSFKERFWIRFFVVAPEVTCRVRNTLRIGL